jgi:hypothetical protein
VWGSNVNNLQGERIGVITEVVIDRPRSKVVFVIIKLDDHFAATPGTRIAVRWSLLRLNLDVLDRSTPYLLDLTRKQLRMAPRLDGLCFRDMCAGRLVMVPVAQHRACCACLSTNHPPETLRHGYSDAHRITRARIKLALAANRG